MKTRPPASPSRILLPALVGLLALAGAASSALAGVTLPFREDWPGTSVDGWGGGAFGATYDNPGAGGTDGAGDGYLRISQPSVGHYGARSFGSEYAGDWLAAAVVRVRVDLNDVGADDTFEIHFGLGNASNFWQYNPGFVPPLNAWQTFEVDLTAASDFTQIIGSGTYAEALQHVDRVLLRQDLAPFVQDPDDTSGDLGVDRLELVGVATPVATTRWGALKARYRERGSRR